MNVSTVTADRIAQNTDGEAERLPVLTAGVAILGLALLCWLPLLLPILAFLH
jgi:hypothetical protein